MFYDFFYSEFLSPLFLQLKHLTMDIHTQQAFANPLA